MTSTSKHSAYDEPVTERTKLEMAVLRKLQRFRDSYNGSNNILYFCNEKFYEELWISANTAFVNRTRKVKGYWYGDFIIHSIQNILEYQRGL
jgi:hypothetical protein